MRHGARKNLQFAENRRTVERGRWPAGELDELRAGIWPATRRTDTASVGLIAAVIFLVIEIATGGGVVSAIGLP